MEDANLSTGAGLAGELSLDALARRVGCPSWPVAQMRFGYHLDPPEWEAPLVVQEVQGMILCRQEVAPFTLPRLRFPAIRAVRPEELAYHPIRSLFERAAH